MGLEKADKGPCEPAPHFITIKTNEHGDLELHPCGGRLFGLVACGLIFVRSVEQDTWVDIDDDELLRQRIHDEVKKAMAERVPGFIRNFHV